MNKEIVIQFDEDKQTPEEMADLIRHVAGLVQEGFGSGHYPNWQINPHEGL